MEINNLSKEELIKEHDKLFERNERLIKHHEYIEKIYNRSGFFGRRKCLKLGRKIVQKSKEIRLLGRKIHRKYMDE